MEAELKRQEQNTGEIYDIPEEDVCLHTPDKFTDFIHMEERGNSVIRDYRCSCGKLVREIYTYSETVVI